MKRVYSNVAFTLAEVLIVLTIIGVVATLTIPALINNTQDLQYKTAWKKSYSVLSQAFEQLVADNGGSITGIYATDKGTEAFKNDMMKELSYIKDCHGIADYSDTGVTGGGASADGCWHDANNWFYLYGGKDSNLPGQGGLILKDGTIMFFNLIDSNCTNDAGEYKRCATILVNINGFKAPNTIGKDIYGVNITSNQIIPWGAKGYFDPATTCIEDSTAVTNTGGGCAAKYL